ncbi:MAG: phosphate/phosphite/phosphonate ABC transporter substrate-binding protein [Myxococcaceae bacterium]|nr:phosphate/phosphite/phosphonate ABC transporter substrate-binding protein [Myxococcaceae bacterium]
MPRPQRDFVRFALPPSLGESEAKTHAGRLEAHFQTGLGKRTEVVVAASYEALAKDLLSGKVDAAWAPPFVCARIEAMGVRVLVRGVRDGASSYRAALVCKAGRGLTLETLAGKTAAWTDRDSVGGYLLPMAFLRGKGLDPNKLFAKQDLVGSYKAALEAVLLGKADVTSIFAPAGKDGDGKTGADQLVPGREKELQVIAFTDESPNDGVAVSMSAPAGLVLELEKLLLTMHEVAAGAQLLKDAFHVDRFEVAQRMGYRALYRVALASL